MRTGITIQHASESSGDSSEVRSDIAGIIAVIPRPRWPRGATQGDYMELPLESYADLLGNPGRLMFDPVSRRAVKSFFENGGRYCKVIGLCVSSKQDLLVEDPFESLFESLLDRLRGEEDLGIVMMPMLAYLPVQIDGATARVFAQPIMELLLAHCHEMNNRFLILDAPKDLHGEPLKRWVAAFRRRNAAHAAYGAIYYPWLMSGDEMFPPSGAMGGVFARVDHEHRPYGVYWPPANEVVHGVTHPAMELSWADGDALTQANINPILVQPTRGVVVWGARTLSRDARWRHINSRRIVSYICEQLRRDSEWVVFENQRPELWAILERMVRSRLDQLWGGGLLAGDSPGSEYLVKCDAEINPPEVRDAGQVHVQIVLRPINTTESIVVEMRLGESGSVVGSV